MSGLRKVRGLLIVGLAVMLIPSLAYGLYVISRAGRGWLETDYIVALMAGWLATMMGVVVGLPVAIWLADRVAAADNRQRAADEERLAKDARSRILHTVKRELGGSLPALSEMTEGVLTKVHYNVGHWNALNSSGDLKWVKDLEVLDNLAEAYEALEVVNILAAGWLRAIEAGQNGLDVSEGELVRRLSVDAAIDAVAAVGRALDKLEEELGSGVDRKSKVHHSAALNLR